MLKDTIEKFYDVYAVPPHHKAGEDILVTDARGQHYITLPENVMPILYDYVYLRLLAYLSQNQEWETFTLPNVGTEYLKQTILEWYLRNRHMVNRDMVIKILNTPGNVEVI